MLTTKRILVVLLTVALIFACGISSTVYADDVSDGPTKASEIKTDRTEYASSQEGVVYYLDTDFTKDDNLDYTFNKYGYIKSVKIHFLIKSNAGKTINLPVSEASLNALNLYAQCPGNDMPSYPSVPGDTFQMDYDVTLDDGVTTEYTYKDGSFSLTTPVTKGETSFIGFDGQKLPYNYVSALAKSAPIQKLLGVTNASKITIDKVLNIYSVLKDKGYTGDDALTKYMLDYYNNQLGTSYATFQELEANSPASIVNMQGGAASAQYIVTASALEQLKKDYPKEFDKGYIREVGSTNESYTLQLKWPEKALAEASYNLFYKDFFVFSFGTDYTYDTFSKYVNSSTGTTLGIGDYMAGKDGPWASANAYLNGISPVNENEQMTFNAFFGLNGPYVNNAYQCYDYSYANTITLMAAPENYTTTVNFIDEESGDALKEPIVSEPTEEGTAYDVTEFVNIIFEGYTYTKADGDAFTGNLDGNKVINLYYKPDEVKPNDDDPGDNRPTDPGDIDPNPGDKDKNPPAIDPDEPTAKDNVNVTAAKKKTTVAEVKTGDTEPMGLYAAMGLVALSGLVGMIAVKRKGRNE